MDQFERGDLPRVCVASGGPSNGRVVFRYQNRIGWVWVLLPFGVLPFLLAMFFTAKSTKGPLPVDRDSWERYRRLQRRSSRAWAAYGLVVATAGLLAFVFRSSLPIEAVLGLAGTAAIGAVTVHVRHGVASLVPGRLESNGRVVVLRDVHRNFAQAFRQDAADRSSGRSARQSDPATLLTH